MNIFQKWSRLVGKSQHDTEMPEIKQEWFRESFSLAYSSFKSSSVVHTCLKNTFGGGGGGYLFVCAVKKNDVKKLKSQKCQG